MLFKLAAEGHFSAIAASFNPYINQAGDIDRLADIKVE